MSTRQILLLLVCALSTTHSSDVLVSNNAQCTTVGKQLLENGATVEQTYVSVSLCEGLVHPMDSGLGGGFQALVHHDERRSYYLMSREYSPYNASFRLAPFILGNSVGVPAVLAGYARLLGVDRCISPDNTRKRLHLREYSYDGDCVNQVISGRRASGFDRSLSGVPYADVFQPVIKLAKYGFAVSPTLNDVLDRENTLPLFLRVTTTPTKKRITNERLATFLEHLAQDPLRLIEPYVRWKNRLVSPERNVREIMLHDVRTFGSPLTTVDFLSYRAVVRRPFTVPFTHRGTRYSLTTMPSPAGGETIAFFAKAIERANELRAHETMSHIQLSCLFVLLNKYAFAVKPYFRGWSRAKVRTVVRRDAPAIAEKFYRDLIVRTTESALMNYLTNEVPGIPTRFGGTTVAEIRVSANRTRSSDASKKTSTKTARTTTTTTTELPTIDETAFEEDEKDEEFADEDEFESSFNDAEWNEIESNVYGEDEILEIVRANESVDDVDVDAWKEWTTDDEVNYLNSPAGTTNVIVKRGNRSIVATSSINHSFGSLIFSQNLGIPYNNVMRDFTPYTWYMAPSMGRDKTNFDRYVVAVKSKGSTTSKTTQTKKTASVGKSKTTSKSSRRRRNAKTTEDDAKDDAKTTKADAKTTKKSDSKNDKTTAKRNKHLLVANRPLPHTVPQSSMACTIISNTETGFPVFGIGAAGGFKITSAVMNVMWNYFVLGDSLTRAINRLRLTSKINYKTRETEIWHEFPTDSLYYKKLLSDSGLLYSGPTYHELNFDTSNETSVRNDANFYHRAHSPEFFFRYRDELNVKYVFEAGYSAATAFSTMGERKPQGVYDPRRGGSVYVKP